MKILFDGVNFRSSTGPNTFASRLAAALHSRGHSIVDPTDDYEIMLTFIEQSQPNRPGSLLVQRLDGIWFKPENFKQNNKRIKACYEKSDLVIWQSMFDKGMTIHHWGTPSAGTVIPNGIDMTPVPAITVPMLAKLRNDHEMIFVSSSNWHPQKRLRDNIKLFYHLRDNFYSDAMLLVMGSNPDASGDKTVLYTGTQPHDVCMQVFAAANWMLHLAWLDHCPNVVVESLSQGTPVICTDQGGTHELVRAHGIVLSEWAPYNFELTDYDRPPSVDVTQITEPLPDRRILPPHADINIETCAERYERALEGLLEEK